MKRSRAIRPRKAGAAESTLAGTALVLLESLGGSTIGSDEFAVGEAEQVPPTASLGLAWGLGCHPFPQQLTSSEEERHTFSLRAYPSQPTTTGCIKNFASAGYAAEALRGL